MVTREIDCLNIVFHAPEVISIVDGKPLSDSNHQNMALVKETTTTTTDILFLRMDNTKQLVGYLIRDKSANIA